MELQSAKIASPNVKISVGISILISPDSANALSPMIIVLYRSMLVKDSHPKNASLPTSKSPSCVVTDASEAQPLKVPSEITAIDSGIVIAPIEVYANAYSPIASIESPRFTSTSDLQS